MGYPSKRKRGSRWALYAATFLILGTFACEGGMDVNNAPTEEPGSQEPEPVEPKMPTSEEDCETGEVFAEQSPMRLMTRYEYDTTVRDLIGVDIGFARENFPPENAVDGFENNADSHTVNPLLVRKFMEAAEEIADDAVRDHKSELLNCEPSQTCGQAFVAEFTTKAFRRPATEEEIDIYEDLFLQAFTAYDFDTAMSMTIEAVLQSPQFLYRMEFSDGATPGETVAVDQFEMANRLSYFLWGTMPDDHLMKAAKEGRLETKDQIEAQARRMLDDERAHAVVSHFYRQWLHVDALDSKVKDSSIFPAYDETMSQDWKASIREFVEHVHFEGNGTLDELFTSSTVFMTGAMAPVYNIANAKSGMNEYSFEDGERSGLLTQPALMALLAYPGQGSPIHRGIFVREKLMCQKLGAPPDMMIEPPDPDPNASTRERFAQHSENETCAGCHSLIDPIGFGFERYDGIGRYRTEEAGQPIDDSGEIIGAESDTLNGTFNGAVELSQRLAEANEVQDCIADQWYTFAMGRSQSDGDLCAVKNVEEEFNASGGDFRELIVAIATSDAFRHRIVQLPVEQEEAE